MKSLYVKTPISKQPIILETVWISGSHTYNRKWKITEDYSSSTWQPKSSAPHKQTKPFKKTSLKPWLDLTMPMQLFWLLNLCLEASSLQETVRLPEIAKHFSSLLLHQQHFPMPMQTVQQQARNSFLHQTTIINAKWYGITSNMTRYVSWTTTHAAIWSEH